jgi:hypothetical protein
MRMAVDRRDTESWISIGSETTGRRRGGGRESLRKVKKWNTKEDQYCRGCWRVEDGWKKDGEYLRS